MAVVAIISVGVISWIWTEWDFRVVKPRELQRNLFGAEIATYGNLEHASNGCCAMDGSGILEWAYTIKPQVAVLLAKRCRLPDGRPRPFAGNDAPFYDIHFHRCVVASRYDASKGEDVWAQVKGRTLTIRLFYEDT